MFKLGRLLILGICIVILIVACNRSPNSSTSDKPNGMAESEGLASQTQRATSDGSESCRLVQHEMGETEVCGQPQKVVALSPYILDNMLALGVQPVAYAGVKELKIQTYDNPTEQIPYLGQWITTKLIALGDRVSPSLEGLALAQPDLILGEVYTAQDEYPLLTQIAPTLLFKDQKADGQISWQTNIKEIAQALGREAQAEELLTRHSQRVAAVREQLASVVAAHPRMLVIYFDIQNNIINLGEDSTAARLLQRIGFEIVSSKNSSLLSEAKPFENSPQISIELLPQIETDFICVMAWSNEDDKPQATLKQQWATNPLLKQVPAFKDGKVFFVYSYLWGGVTRGPLTDQLILEALPDLLLDSVKKAGGAEEAEEAALGPLCFKKNA